MPLFLGDERLAFGPWAALERAVARLLQHAGFKDVTLVGGAGDNGADVVATRGAQRWVVQAKYRSGGGADAAGAREAVRALNVYHADVAVAATNMHFTPDAFRYHQATQADGIDLRLWDGAYLLQFARALELDSAVASPLRPYQARAVDAVEQQRSSGQSNALVLMATGLGKSKVAASLVANEISRNPSQEVLVLAHTVDLVRQLEQSCWPSLAKDIPTHLWTDGEEPSFSGGVVFATWQSLQAPRTHRPLRDRFGLVVVDEAHHAPSDSYRRLLRELRPSFLLGLTATPWRGDARSLGVQFGSPCFSMDIVDGLQGGYLAEVDYRMLTDGIDWDEVARLSRQGHTVKQLNTLLLMPERDMAMVETTCATLRSLSGGGRGLGFCRSIEHATRLQPLFLAHGVSTALLHSGLSRDERFKNLSAFRRCEVELLLSVEMLNEGIDVPEVNMVTFMRVTHSRRIFVQQLGRGLRLSPTKSTVAVLDFVADLRRVAAGVSLNEEASRRSRNQEIFRYTDGRVVKFDEATPVEFFTRYVADIAELENAEDGAQLRFPPV